MRWTSFWTAHELVGTSCRSAAESSVRIAVGLARKKD